MEEQNVLTMTEAEEIRRIMFEDDEEIFLRDGKSYQVVPCMLGDALELIEILGQVDVTTVMLNFAVDPNDENGKENLEKRIESLYRGLLKAFVGYPEIDAEYLKKYCDVLTAQKIFNILVGINGIKK